MKGVADRPVTRVVPGARIEETDRIAIEEPLEVRIDGDAIAVTMRTPGAPGDDARLALGFLYSEGIIRGGDDVSSVSHCDRPGDEGYGNVIDVRSGPGVSLEVERPKRALERRSFVVSASCGVCGRRSIDELRSRCQPVDSAISLRSGDLARAMAEAASAQPSFAVTGGLHAAAAFTERGDLIACYEDVGRHNAVDKVVGALVQERRIGQAALLTVSGRSSFEIVQKAAVARIPIVASISAPSTLAIDLARDLGMTLCGFVRGHALNVYSGEHRITL